MHPALHLSAAHRKGNLTIPRLHGADRLVVQYEWIFSQGSPFEPTLPACNQPPECEGSIPAMSVLPSNQPSFSDTVCWRFNIISHERSKAASVFTRQLIAKLPEDGAI